MGESIEISEISIRFLQNQISWIFLPEEVEIYISENNKDFKRVFQKSLINDEKDLHIRIQNISFTKASSARYVIVKAKHIGHCPEWHPGRQSLGWLFVDEVIIK